MWLRTTALLLALPLGSCAGVMEAYGDHVIYAEGHAWHTWPARFGVGVVANVLPIVLLPLGAIEVVTGNTPARLYVGINTSVSLAVGVVLGTPTYVLGLPFASCAEEPPAASAASAGSAAENR